VSWGYGRPRLAPLTDCFGRADIGTETLHEEDASDEVTP
jgi:hypothetical protein